jgi:ABC-type nitrate/sulfonate/bicarbonate transport system substrate-binding protein
MTVEALWYTRCPVPTASGIALAEGWLEEEFGASGIPLRALTASPDPAVRRSHFEHTVPNSLRQGGNIPPLVARSHGADVKVLAFSWPTISHRVLVRPDSDIETVAALRGRRLSLPVRADRQIDFWQPTVLRGYEQALATAGLTLDDARLVRIDVDTPLQPEQAPAAEQGGPQWSVFRSAGFQQHEAAALLDGRVDALFTEHSSSAQLRSVLGLRTVIDLAPPGGDPPVNNGIPLVLTASGTLIDERPDLVARWITRLLAAPAWTHDHEGDARRIFAREAGLAEDLVAESFPGPLAEHLPLHVDERSVAALDSQLRFLVDHGFVEQAFDVDEILALDIASDTLGAATVATP